jgi:hypothetical protein
MENKIVDLVNQMRQGKLGTPIEEHAAKVFAFRDEFIAYLNKGNHSKDWIIGKLDRYSPGEFMDIVKEAEEKGVTFEEVEGEKMKSQTQMIKTALESLVGEFEK